MHAIGLSSEVYLFYMLVLLPWVAFRSAKAFNAPPPAPGAAPARPLPSRTRLYANTTGILVVLFFFARFTARTFSYDIFAVPHLGARELLAGASGLACCFGMIFVNRAMRTPEEIRNMPVHRLMPQTSRERALYSASAIVAGIAEEAAYRGVLMAILWYALGNPWLAVLISATAFALGHAVQGWKSMIVIFVIAVTMHALVWFTGTLVIAMAVHAIYDLLAPAVRRRLLARLE
jgi:membrane protease YdiL (CAAX protease family)